MTAAEFVVKSLDCNAYLTQDVTGEMIVESFLVNYGDHYRRYKVQGFNDDPWFPACLYWRDRALNGTESERQFYMGLLNRGFRIERGEEPVSVMFGPLFGMNCTFIAIDEVWEIKPCSE